MYVQLGLFGSTYNYNSCTSETRNWYQYELNNVEAVQYSHGKKTKDGYYHCRTKKHQTAYILTIDETGEGKII